MLSIFRMFDYCVSIFTGPPLNVVSLNQVEKDTVMVGYDHILILYVGGADVITWVGLV